VVKAICVWKKSKIDEFIMENQSVSLFSMASGYADNSLLVAHDGVSGT